MIRETYGNLLEAETDAVVNTVNTVGVMGKGIALQFKKVYPAMFADYKQAAKAGKLSLGRMHVWPTGQIAGVQYVINFPTKGHWKSRSQLSDVIDGLRDLTDVIRELDIRSIALPPLGCGNGGLNWTDVEPEIRRAFSNLPDVDVLLFPPTFAPRAADIRSTEPLPRMTVGRAALISIVNRYTNQSLSSPSLIEIQKLMYFLQVGGESLRLRFVADRYGPYADNLRHVLNVVEGHYLSGFGDGSAAVTEAEPLVVLPGAEDQAAQVLSDHPDTQSRVQRVLELSSGYESSYGLELLATVHWLASHNSLDELTEDELVNKVREWSPRKGRMFTPEHIRTAHETLIEDEWLSQGRLVAP